MDTRNFFALQNVQPEELNSLVDVINHAIEQVGYETGGRGVVYGLKVQPTSPASLAVKVGPGAARFFVPATVNTGTNSNRKGVMCRLAVETSISLGIDYLGASTAVSAGQERWVTLAIRPKTVESDPRTSLAPETYGQTINFVVTESAELIVVGGYATTAGQAVPPDVSGVGIRLADFLLTNTTAVAPEINLQRREDFVTSVMGGDLTSNALGNNDGYSLLWESKRNEALMGVFRMYLCQGGTGLGPKGICLTWNAYWVALEQKWHSPQDGLPTVCLRFTENGLVFTKKTSAQMAGWVERTTGGWDTTVILSQDGHITAEGLGTEFEMVVAISQMSGHVTIGQGAVPPITVVLNFPKYITSPFAGGVIADAFESADHSIQGGVAADSGVASVSTYVTNTCAIFRIQPTAIDTYVNYVRKVRFYTTLGGQGQY